MHKTAKISALGALLYYIFYKPKGIIKNCFHLGIINSFLLSLGKSQMKMATYHLKPIQVKPDSKEYDVHFLSGKNFWYQTCFCVYSLIKYSPINVRPVIYDDGTLRNNHIQLFKKVFPSAVIILQNEINLRLDKFLPESKFPLLRRRRIYYPNLRKLLDMRVGNIGWQLVFDSDIIFFREPKMLINWLKSPQKPCHLVDLDNFYGYTEELMESIVKRKIPQRVNVGIIGINNDNIDWEELEFWYKTMLEKEGEEYALEQALTAMLISDSESFILSNEDYILNPSIKEAKEPKKIMHHYVADSKLGYFRYAWRHVIGE